jgi:phosphatidate cytidylyltransferase
MRKETKIRILTSAIAIPLSILCFFNFWSVVLLSALAVGLAGYNYIQITLQGSRKLHRYFYITAIPALNIVFGLLIKDSSMIVLTYSLVMSTGFFLAIIFNDPNDVIEKNIVYGSLGLWYLSFNLAFFILIYSKFDGAYSLSALASAYVFDSGAYFIGSRWGKHKFIKRISAGKSIEGIIGGFAFLILFFFIYDAVLRPFVGWTYFSWEAAIILSAAFAFFDTVGDITQSVFKRNRQIKNAGNILPGHGGFWDRIDGLLIAVPMYYVLFTILNDLHILKP